jgi:RNA polymerase sigma factor (sigma-70 family)
VKPEQEPTYHIVRLKKKEGLALLYERYGRRLYGYALHSWKLAEDEAWDLVYKTLYKVFDTTAEYTFESEKKYGSFIFKVFVNYLRQHYRDTKRLKSQLDILPLEETELPGETPAEEPKAPGGKMALLQEVLDTLEDWERMLLLLRSQDMPYSEIARYVNRPEEQLKVYYQRLKATVAKRMNDKLTQNETDEK